MLKLAHIYSLLILGSLIRLAERDDELKSDESALKEEHLLLASIRNLVQLAAIKLRQAYRSGYELVNFNASFGFTPKEYERLKSELKAFLYMVDSKRHALFNHRYRILLAQINVLIDEIPRFDIATFDNTSVYQRVGLCFLSICNSLCRFFNSLECSVSKLEEYNRKIDRLQMIANELRYFADNRRPRRDGKRTMRRRKDQLGPSERLDFRQRREDDNRRARVDGYDFRRRKTGEDGIEFRRRRAKNDNLDFRNSRTRENAFEFRRTRTKENHLDLRARMNHLRRTNDGLDFRRKAREDDFDSGATEDDELDLREGDDHFDREFRSQARAQTKRSRQKGRQISPLRHLIRLISYQYSKYHDLVDRLYSITQDYWELLTNKFNEIFTSV